MALEQQTIALIGVGVVIIGVTVGLHSITQADIRDLRTVVGTDINGLRGDVSNLGERVSSLETRIDELDQQLLGIDQRLGKVETRLTSVETRLGNVENQVAGLHGRLGRVETDLNTILALGYGVEPSSDVLDVPPVNDDPRSAKEATDPLTGDVGVAAVDIVAEAFVVAEVVHTATVDDIVLAEAAIYRIVEEKDSSFGTARRRVTLETEIDGADPTAPIAIKTMMRAATDRHQVDQPDAVSVRLWRSYEDDSNAQNRLVYAPDGCGWSGDDCTGELWTDLLKGDMPNE